MLYNVVLVSGAQQSESDKSSRKEIKIPKEMNKYDNMDKLHLRGLWDIQKRNTQLRTEGEVKDKRFGSQFHRVSSQDSKFKPRQPLQ